MAFSKLWVLLIVFILALAGLRFFLVTADSPSSVSSSMAFFTDEGAKADYPRILFFGKENQLFIGDFCEDCFMPFIYNFNTAFINLPFLASFYLFGPGLFSARLVGIVLSLASLAILFLLAKNLFGLKPALIAVALLAANFAFFAFNRLAFFENFCIFFITAGFYAMYLALEKGSKLWALSGLALFSIALLCKFTSFIAFPGIAFLFLCFSFKKVSKAGRAKFVLFSAGFFILLNIFLLSLNQNASIQGLVILDKVPDSLFLLARDFLIAPVNNLFAVTPLFSLLGFSGALLIAFESLQEKDSVKKFFKQAFALTVFFGFFALGFFTYQPPRYFYMLLPFLAIFSGIVLSRLFSKKPLANIKKPVSLVEKGFLLFAAFFTAFALASNAVKFLGLEIGLSMAYYIFIFFAVLAVFGIGLKIASKKASFFQNTGAGKAGFFIACLLFAAIVLLQVSYYASWASSPSYSLVESSRRFGEISSGFEEPVAAGQWCSYIGLETDVLCQRGSFDGPIKEELFQQLEIDLLLADEIEWESYKDTYNGYKTVGFVKIDEFSLGGLKVFLFLVE